MPKFHYADFHRNFPATSRGHRSWKSRTQTVTNHETMKFRWKSPTQITKVADTNHLDMSRCLRQSPWQVRDKPVCVALMEFSPLQCTGKVGDKVVDKVRGLCRGHKSRKSATQIMKVGDVICVADFHDLCPRHVCYLVGILSRTLSQSRRYGIWAMLSRVWPCWKTKRFQNHT